MTEPKSNDEFKEWLVKIVSQKPKGNYYLDSTRGQYVAKLMLEFERDDFNWHRSDEDTFWIDVQMCVKYKLTDEEIIFMMKQQPGTINYKKYSSERNAYAEMMRGLNKLRQINAKEVYSGSEERGDCKV